MRTNKWFIFCVVISFYFLSYFYRCSTAVIAPDLVHDFAIGPANLGLLSSIYFYTFAVAQFPIGPALDRLGPRIMAFFMGLVAAAGAVIFAIAPTFLLAVLGRGLIGLGVSVAYMGTLKIIAHWFHKDEFAMMSALAMAIGNVGALTATVPLAMASAWLGWRTTFLILSLLTVASITAIFFWVRDYPPQGRQQDNSLSCCSARESLAEGISIRKSFMILLATGNFWLIALLEFCWFGTFIGIQGLWGGPYLMDVYGLSPAKAGSILGMIAIGFICGGPLLGWLSDAVIRSRKKVILAGMGGYALVIAVLLAVQNLSSLSLYLLFFLFGFAGSSGIIGYAHIKESFPLAMSATVMSSINFFAIGGAALIQHLMGFIIKIYPAVDSVYPFAAYRSAFLFCFAAVAAALIGYCRSQEGER
ncbi:MAG: MFS transporter [Deltaproteobacteria bacterium]|nr:MFS transporter [Candidatus Anaeroferrophillus wilburensis]MBN2888321.1 MFS transporter [Deltaproteobacteria bacterium]